jgi:hypothetical protein
LWWWSGNLLKNSSKIKLLLDSQTQKINPLIKNMQLQDIHTHKTFAVDTFYIRKVTNFPTSLTEPLGNSSSWSL